MNVTATLAGYRASWRFRDSQLVAAWMASRPWDGGANRVAVFRMSSRAYEHLIIEATAREARAHEPDPARIRSEVLDIEESLEEPLLTRFEISGSVPRIERLRQLTRILESTFWVLMIRSAAAPEVLRDAAQELLDTCTKLGGRPTATIIFLHTAAATADSRDLVVGCLADGILQEAERGLDRLWRAFVASRIAWESGGDLGRAIELDRAIGPLAIGDEIRLEHELNASARERIRLIAHDQRRMFDEYVRTYSDPNSAGRRRRAALDGELRASSLLWRPVGEQRSRPAPWASRALLLENPEVECRHVLRSSIVNAVLANEVLRRCFDLESLLVARSWSELRGLESQLEEAQELKRRFAGGRLQENGYYPADCPALPRDAWSFASLGEILSLGTDPNGGGVDAWKLLRLRNALAHGHYVNWRAVLDVLEIEEQVGEG